MIRMQVPPRILNLKALGDAPVCEVPFPFLIVPSIINDDCFADVCASFPKIEQRGSFPLASLECGPAFAALCDELQHPAVRDCFQEKLRIDLSQRPTTITVRGQTGKSDGSIHVDSRSKLVTVLIYLNEAWDAEGGRLRLLQSAASIDDMVAEVPPSRGAAVAFVNMPNAWHGHQPFVGPRRSIQLNWVTSRAALASASLRKGWSARVKKVFRFSAIFGKSPSGAGAR